jgi:RNA polymerase sigma-70 factor (ECF subfamily)
MILYNHTGDQDSALLQRLEQGDKTAFDALYEKYWEQAYSNAYKRLKDTDLSKDVVQEIFLSIWINRANHINNLPAYLNVAVRNRVLKQIQKQKGRVPFLEAFENAPELAHQLESNVLWKEFYRAFESLLTTLPPKRQEIFRLRFNDDLSTKDIASRLGLSRKTVQNQLGKAIEQLRVSLVQMFLLFILWMITCTI